MVGARPLQEEPLASSHSKSAVPWTMMDGNAGCAASISQAPTRALKGSSLGSMGIFVRTLREESGWLLTCST